MRVRAQTEQLSGVVDRLRKKKNERKKKKKNILFAMQRQISLSVGFFLHQEAIVAAGRYLSIYIWKERACLNRHRERENWLRFNTYICIVYALSISHLST